MMITSNSLLSFILSNFVKAVNGKGKANAVKASPSCLMISRLVILLLIFVSVRFLTFYLIERIIFVYFCNFEQAVVAKFFLYGFFVIKEHFYPAKHFEAVFPDLFSLSVSLG